MRALTPAQAIRRDMQSFHKRRLTGVNAFLEAAVSQLHSLITEPVEDPAADRAIAEAEAKAAALQAAQKKPTLTESSVVLTSIEPETSPAGDSHASAAIAVLKEQAQGSATGFSLSAGPSLPVLDGSTTSHAPTPHSSTRVPASTTAASHAESDTMHESQSPDPSNALHKDSPAPAGSTAVASGFDLFDAIAPQTKVQSGSPSAAPEFDADGQAADESAQQQDPAEADS
jgi:hypothetical protein